MKYRCDFLSALLLSIALLAATASAAEKRYRLTLIFSEPACNNELFGEP
jgi:hypothetical protein